jgi:hypothetical protein
VTPTPSCPSLPAPQHHVRVARARQAWRSPAASVAVVVPGVGSRVSPEHPRMKAASSETAAGPEWSGCRMVGVGDAEPPGGPHTLFELSKWGFRISMHDVHPTPSSGLMWPRRRTGLERLVGEPRK